jgi:hypothetical protein
LDAREANDRIAEKAARLNFVSRAPMLCECSATGCRKIVMVSLEEYRRIREDPDAFITAPGHQFDGAESQEETPNYTIHRLRHRNGNGGRRSA